MTSARRSHRILLAFACILIAGTAHAAERTWSGNADPDESWGNDENWLPFDFTIPSDGDDIVLAFDINQPVINAALPAGQNDFNSLIVRSGLTLDMNNNTFSISDFGTVPGSGDVGAGGVRVEDLASITSSGGPVTINIAGDFTVAGGDTFALDPNVVLAVAGNVVLEAGATLDLNGVTGGITIAGDLTLQDGAAIANSGGAATLTVGTDLFLGAGGAVTVAADVALEVGGITTINVGAGNDLSLTNAANDFDDIGGITVSSVNNLTIVDTNGTTFNASTISGNLDVDTTGAALNDSGAIDVTGTATFDAGANAITLGDGTAANFGTVDVTGGVVSVNESSATDIAGASVGDTLTVTSAGAIVDTGDITVTNAATFTAGGATPTITLGDASTANFGSIDVTGGAVSVNESSATDIAGASVGDTLSVTSTGAIIDTGDITVTNLATFTAGGATPTITLGDASTANFGSIDVSGSVVSVNESSETDIAAASVGDTLTVTSTGAITDTGAITVTNAATFDAGANAITLGDATAANFGSVSLTGGTVTVNESSAMEVAGATTGALSLTANGAITQTADIDTSGGGITLEAGAGNNITLGRANNTFDGDVVITSGDTVELEEDGPLEFGASTVSGNLDVTADGGADPSTAISQSAAITVVGDTTFRVKNTANQDVLMGTLGNDFSGSVSLAAASGNVRDFYIRNVNALATVGAITTTVGRDLYIEFNNAGIDLPAMTVNRNLTAIAGGGAITDSGDVTVGTLGTFDAGANAITLGDGTAANFGSVDVTGGVVSVNESSATDIAGASVSDTLTVTSTGAISDTGDITVTNAATFDAGANAITLGDGTAANFGTVDVTGGVVSVNESSATDIAGASVGDTLTVTSAGAIVDTGDITVTNAATFTAGGATPTITLGDASTANFGSIDVTGGAVSVNESSATDIAGASVGDTLSVTSTGAIIDTGDITVTNLATFTAGGATPTITLGDASTANFGSIDVSGSVVSVNESSETDIAGASVSDALTVSSAGGIVDTGAVSVTNAASFTATAAGDIDLGTTTITAPGTIDLATTSGNATISSAGGWNLAGANIVGGYLSITAGGAVGQSGAILTPSLLLRGAGDYTLTDAGNTATSFASDATGTVSYRDSSGLTVTTVNGVSGVTTGGADLALETGDTLAINRPIDSGTGNVDLTAGNTISQGVTGTMNVGGTTDFTLTAAGDVDIDTVANTFEGNVTFADNGNIANLYAWKGSGAAPYPVIPSGLTDLVIIWNGVDPDVGGIDVSGTLVLSTDGTMTQSGPIVADRLLLRGTGSYELTNVLNNVITALASDADGSVEFTDRNDLTVGSVDPPGPEGPVEGITSVNSNLRLEPGATSGTDGLLLSEAVDVGTADIEFDSAGAVTQNAGATVSAGGLELLGTGPYTLELAGNDVDTVAVDTDNALSFVDANDLTIGSVTTFAGATTGLDTNGTEAVIQTGGTLTIDDDVDVGGANLELNTADATTQVAGDTITAGGLRLVGTGPYTLDDGGNDVDVIAAEVDDPISFRDANDVAVGTITTSKGTTTGITTTDDDTIIRTGTTLSIDDDVSLGAGDLELNSGAGTTQVAGDTIAAGGLQLLGTGPYTLDDGGNNVDRIAANTGDGATYTDSDDLIVGSVTTATGTTNGITTTDADVTLQTGTGLTISEAIDVIDTGSANVTLNAGGATSQTATITATGLQLLGTGGYTLDDGGNDVDTLAADVTNALTFNDTDGYTVGSVGATNGVTTSADGTAPVDLATASGDITMTQSIGSTNSAIIVTVPSGGELALDAGVAIDSAPGAAGANVTLNADVGDLGNNTLTVDAGTGTAEFGGAIGLVGSPNNAPQNVDVNAVRVLFSGAATGGTDDIRVGNALDITGATNGVVMTLDNDGTMSAGGGVFDWPWNLYLDLTPAAEITLLTDLTVAGHLVFFNGTFSLADRTITIGDGAPAGTTVDDLVIFGSNYDPDDLDWSGGDTRFAYPDAGDWVYADPGSYDVTFTDLDDTLFDLTSGDDFYLNGADMDAAGVGTEWELRLPDQSGAVPAYPAVPPGNNGGAISAMGNPYAIALNGAIGFSEATGGYVAAAEPAGSWSFNNTSDGGGNNAYWDFTAPVITSAETVYDDVVRVTFSEDLENEDDEINTSIGLNLLRLDGNTIPYGPSALLGWGASYDADGDDLPPLDLQNVDTQGDIGASRSVYLNSPSKWRTDATGADPGDAISTDQLGTTPTPAVLPDITMPKGLFHDGLSRNLAANYGRDGIAAFEPADETAPVLVAVEVGRFDHDQAQGDPALYETIDGKNYFQLRYSEAVDIGGAAGPGFLDSAGADGLGEFIDTELDTRRATVTFGAGDTGGYIDDGGGSGTVAVAGYFEYPGTFVGGSTDGTPSTAMLYRRATTPGGTVTNTYGDHGLRIVVAGHSQVEALAAREWTGFITSADDPDGDTVYLDPANQIDIRDVAPNANVLLDSTEPRYAGNEPVIVPDPAAADPVLQAWDIDAPDVAMFRPNDLDSDYEEIVTMETGGSAAFLDRVEIHVHDNPSNRTGWISAGPGVDHPDTPPADGAQGIRDYQVEAALDNGQLYFDFQGQTSPRPFPAGTTFDTAVNNGFFAQDDLDDSYVGFQMPLDANNFPIQATMWLAFTPTIAQTGASDVITDIAGNAMQPFSRYTSIERIPPEIAVTLAIADTDRIYLRFNEYVKGAGGAALAPGDFAIEDETGAPTGISVTSVDVLRTDPDDPQAVLDVILTLDAELGRDDVLRYRVGPSAAGTIEDRFAAPIEADEDNRVTDIAMGVVEPTAAWNEIQRDDLYGDEFAGLLDASEFDGSGILLDRTTTLQATIQPVPSSPGANDALPLLMYYDVEPDEKYLTPDGYWVIEESEIVDDPQTQEVESVPRNTEARVLSPTAVDGPVREFVVPESDPEFQAGAEIEFMFSIDGIPAARALDSNDPRSVDQWSFRLTPFVAQKAGVTILNNVIWPENGDKTMLSLDLERAGIITAQVFTLDGQVVDVLQRGRLTAGEHFLTWDGTNASGQIVASGLYFIRVVGPEIDEIRKVLVAK